MQKSDSEAATAQRKAERTAEAVNSQLRSGLAHDSCASPRLVHGAQSAVTSREHGVGRTHMVAALSEVPRSGQGELSMVWRMSTRTSSRLGPVRER